MKIYVSDDIYEYLTIGKRDKHSGVDVDFVVKSLEQHDAEVRKQELQKVIAELEEWIKENHKYYICRTQTNHLRDKSFSPHMAGSSIPVYLDTFMRKDIGLFKAKGNKFEEVESESNTKSNK